MVGHGGSSAGSYLADPTSPIPSHCASIVTTSTLRVNNYCVHLQGKFSHIYPLCMYATGPFFFGCLRTAAFSTRNKMGWEDGK